MKFPSFQKCLRNILFYGYIKYHNYLNRNMENQQLEKLKSDLMDVGFALDTE